MSTTERCNSTSPAQARALAAGSPGESLQCLSRGYLGGGERCARRILRRTVDGAWRAALEDGAIGEGFFRFSWRGGQWLAYGHSDGHVRGVYCPEHAADRDQRAGAASGAVGGSETGAASGSAAANALVPQPVA